MSWSASPIGGRVHNLLRFDGLFISRRSNVLSFRVGLSVTWCKLWSAIISSSWWCCFASGFPVMNEGIDQSMLPRLKSPPTHMFEEFLSNLLNEILSWSSDVPSSDGGRFITDYTDLFCTSDVDFSPYYFTVCF